MRTHRLITEFSQASVDAWAAETGDLAASESPATWGMLDLAAFLEWAKRRNATVTVVGGGVRYADRSAAGEKR